MKKLIWFYGFVSLASIAMLIFDLYQFFFQPWKFLERGGSILHTILLVSICFSFLSFGFIEQTHQSSEGEAT